MIDNYIEEVRSSMGLSRKELASRSGVSYALLNNLEHGRNQLYSCSVRVLLRIASALDTDPMNLLKEGD